MLRPTGRAAKREMVAGCKRKLRKCILPLIFRHAWPSFPYFFAGRQASGRARGMDLDDTEVPIVAQKGRNMVKSTPMSAAQRNEQGRALFAKTSAATQGRVMLAPHEREAAYCLQLMRRYPVKNGKAGESIVSIGGKGVYPFTLEIPDDVYREFLKDVATKIVCQSFNLQMAEKHRHVDPAQQYEPLMIDVDMDLAEDLDVESYTMASGHLWSNETLTDLVSLCSTKIFDVVRFSDGHTLCIVTTKSRIYQKKGKWHDGFHLHFPRVYVALPVRRLLLFQIKEAAGGIFMSPDCEHLVQSDDIVDINPGLGTPQMLYGCSKAETNDSYKVYCKYTMSAAGVALVDDGEGAGDTQSSKGGGGGDTLSSKEGGGDFDDTASVSSLASRGTAGTGLSIGDAKRRDAHLKRMLLFSIRYKGNRTPSKIIGEDAINGAYYARYPLKALNAAVAVTRVTMSEADAIREKEKDPIWRDQRDLVAQLIACMSVERSDDYHSWYTVGMCLKGTDPLYRQLFHEFSRKSKKYDEAAVDAKWDNLPAESRLKMGTLHTYAMHDNPDLYKTAQTLTLKAVFTDFVNKARAAGVTAFDSKRAALSDDTLAKYIRRYFGDCYKYTVSDEWFQFKGHRWQKLEKGIELTERVVTEMSEVLDGLVAENAKAKALFDRKFSLLREANGRPAVEQKGEVLTAEEEAEQKKIMSIKAASLCIYNTNVNVIQKVSARENLIKAFKGKCFDGTFETLRDDIRGLLCCTNGVLEFTNDGARLRPGKQEDWLTLTTGIDYIPHDEGNDAHQEAVRKILKIYEQIHPFEPLRIYSFYWLAWALTGRTAEYPAFVMRIGDGRNGKSLEQLLLRQALGEYYVTPPRTLLMGGKEVSANVPRPELLALKGKRVAAFSETDEGTQLNIGEMKRLSSGEQLSARTLYSGNMVRFSVQCQANLISNFPPRIDSLDGGTWRRLVWIPYNSRFTENPIKDNEYPIDPSLLHSCETDPVMHRAFLSILVHYYNEMCRLKVKLNTITPECSKEKLIRLMEASNPIGAFMADSVTVGEATDAIEVITLWRLLILWMRENNIPTHNMKQDRLLTHLRVNHGTDYVPETKKLLRMKLKPTAGAQPVAYPYSGPSSK